MAHGIYLAADDSAPPEAREFRRLEDYQAAVGGWIEAVDIAELGVTVYVNEEGLLRRLRFNRRATFLWWYHLPHMRGHARLVGDAVLVGWPDANGNSTDLPKAVSERLTSSAPHNVAVREPGDTRWHPSPEDHDDYFEAIIWATLLLEHAPGLQTRVTPGGALGN